MKKLLPLFVFMLCASSIFAQPSDAYLLSRMNAEKIPGLSTVIVKEGHWIYDKSLGKADIAKNKNATRLDLFLLSSVSNVMIATAIMQLWEKGSLNLDDNINKYLPFQLDHPAYPADTITIRMLLTHTSGLKDNWNIMTSLYAHGDSQISLDTLFKRYYAPGGLYNSTADNYYSYKPGSQWNFCNTSISLAAYILELITGDKFNHYCDTAIFSKLCMKNTSYLLSGIQDTSGIARAYSWVSTNYIDNGLYGSPDYPGAQLRTSSTALARFMTMYMGHGIYEGQRILDSTTVDLMMKPYTPSLWSQTQSLLFQGLGFYTRIVGNGDTLWGQEGRIWGAVAAMYFNYRQKTGVIMLGNGEGTSNPILILDTLYKYGISVNPNANDTFPSCNETSLSINMRERNNPILLFPNPAKGKVSISLPVRGLLRLVDISGRLIGSYQLHPGQNILNIPGTLAEGIYFAHIYDDNGVFLVVKKLIHTP